MVLQYGFLQGTFGLPYGGYCVRPQRLSNIMLSADNPGISMFCVLGRYSDVLAWLDEKSNRTVASLCTTQGTFTHDLTVEVYNKSSTLVRLMRGKGAIDVQLVIRIARTWDHDAMDYKSNPEDGSACRSFRPMLRVLVPSGVALSDISAELERAEPYTLLDATGDKSLLDTVLTRASTRRDDCSGFSDETQEEVHLPGYKESIEQPPPRYMR
ncbi:hypothetical protein H4217_005663 [Coemansia sp. RSA 1939]|nr:hypothetical protein H4217_005663 [Coemansia sp. RSA 1939]KAJ2591896.1 hypothetical protein EV177_008814 [Coemansia sp. RSA 1804]